MAAAKETAVAAAAAAESTKVVKRSGIMEPVSVSPVMKKFLGVSEVTRAQAIKKIWDHIRAKNLQVHFTSF